MESNLQHHSDVGCNVTVLKKKKLDVFAFKNKIAEIMSIEEFCSAFDIKINHDDGTQIRSPCPLHGGKRRDSFSILYTSRENNPMFHWMCRTDCQADGDIIDFVMRKNSCSFEDACQFLATMYGINIKDMESEIAPPEVIASRKELVQLHKEVSNIMEMNGSAEFTPGEYINEEYIAKCVARRNNYFSDRGFLTETLDLFEVGFCPAYDSPWKRNPFRPERVTIPLRDENFRLVGISGRVMKEHEDVPKYQIVKGSNKRDILYGLYFTLPYIVASREAIVVEGFADLWRCWEAGYRNVVALCGKDVLDFHIHKLLSICHSVVNALDEDPSGLVGREKFNLIFKDILTVKNIKFGGDKDIGEMLIPDVVKMFQKNNILACK